MTLWSTLTLSQPSATCPQQVASTSKVDHNVIFNQVFIQKKNTQSNESITKQDYCSIRTIFKNIHVRISCKNLDEKPFGCHGI